ncbi:Phosphoesterase family domain containing protein [Naviculisporaceae sp. PSN 640]
MLSSPIFSISLLGLLLLVSLEVTVTAADKIKIVPGKAFDRFITIWLENQDYAKTLVDEAMVDMAKQGIQLERFYGLTHPSQPNYIAAVGGDYFGMDHDDRVRIPENVSTVVDLLDTRDISWAGYFEDMPGPGYMGDYSDGKSKGYWDYVRKHNPFVSYDSINMNGSRLLNLQSLSDFKRALEQRVVPQFVFISPNMMNDGHNTTLSFASKWARELMKLLLLPEAFDERTLIMLTFDESEDYSKPNQIGTLLLGSAVPAKLKNTKDKTFYTHYSMLSTIEYNWDLPNLGRYDVGANLFRFVGETTGYEVAARLRDPTNADSVNNSESYPGFLSEDASKWLPIPVPNLNLVGSSGKSVVEVVVKNWAGAVDNHTPYDGSGKVQDGGENLPEYKPPHSN